MKHLLITILSFLLLSSPVIGQETGVLYQYETSSGIQWKTFGDGKVQPKYKGEIKNGIMDGLGVLIYPYGEKSVVGEWKEGKEWNTKHTKKDGTLLGKFENGKWIKRRGVLFLHLGGYSSDWSKNGDEEKDKKYVGEIENGLPNGQGTSTYPKGLSTHFKFVGEFKDGKKHGQGTLKGNEFTWEGKWKNGLLHGKVKITRWGKESFVGEYKDGKQDGQGKQIITNGLKFWGKYEGEYKDDRRNGQGTLTLYNGRQYVGEWNNGTEWNGTWRDIDENIIYTYENGVEIQRPPPKKHPPKIPPSKIFTKKR